MIVSDVGKLALLVTFTVGLFVLIAINKITFSDATPFLTLIVGVIIGNGAAAMRREAPSSIIVGRVHDDEVLTVAGSYPAHREGNGDHG